MKISHNWLQQYIDPGLPPAKLAEGLSMLGLEVEHVEELGKRYEGFVVGEVLEVVKHPNADKLTVCKVNVGKEVLQIVCGAPNVAEGQKIVVGLVGATVPRDQHDPGEKPFVLKQLKIRGVESNGMICSEYELDMGEDADGIMVLDPAARIGMSFATHARKNDVVYELEITANRGDWLSHFGVAREVSALTGKRWKQPSVTCKESKEQAAKAASVKIIEKQKCPRYVARVIRNISVQPSPTWLQDYLSAAGARPINTVVDITNFVMLETGQPLHAFDYDKIAGHSINVRCAAAGQKFLTLDGKERSLDGETLMICDADGPVAIAGIMGGSNSEISESTKNVLLESACFDPAGIRRTAKLLGLSTESSRRFERTVDVSMTLYAANRAAQLLQELAGGEVLKGVIDVYPMKRRPSTLRLRVSKTNSILGTSLSNVEVIRCLKRLGLVPRQINADTIAVPLPTFRNDLVDEIDLIEEVARVYGYNRIEIKTESSVDFSSQVHGVSWEDEVRSYLIGQGFHEVLTNSLQNKAHATMSGEPAVEVLNPVSMDMEMLRTSLIPGALDVVKHNYNHGQQGLRLFEIGKTYRRNTEIDRESPEGYTEERRILLLVSGEFQPQQYGVTSRKCDIFDLKGEVEALLLKFFLDKYRLNYYNSDKPLSVNNIDIEIQDTYAGFVGMLKKEVAAKFDIEEAVLVSELSGDTFAKSWQTEKRFRALPRFPAVRRDLAFIVEKSLPQDAVEQALRESGGSLLSKVSLFDLYVGDQAGAERKSLAYTLEFQPTDRTLTDQEINTIVSRIVDHVQKKCRATLRA